MLGTAISPPAIRARSGRPLAVAAVITGVLNAGVAAVQVLAPAQPADGHHFVRASDYVIEYLFAGSLLAAACAVTLLARYHRERGRWGVLGMIAAAGYALGTGLFGVSSALTAVRGTETLDVVQFPAIAVWLVSGLLLAIALVRARVLPVAAGLGFAAALPATMALGHAGPFALAILWLAVTGLITRRTPGQEPAS
jgi:hypothetical protein